MNECDCIGSASKCSLKPQFSGFSDSGMNGTAGAYHLYGGVTIVLAW